MRFALRVSTVTVTMLMVPFRLYAMRHALCLPAPKPWRRRALCFSTVTLSIESLRNDDLAAIQIETRDDTG
jgi:hypothetical protein